MTVVSVVSIDVEDEKFKAFQANFHKYEASLKALPGAWGAVDDAAAATVEDIATMTAALMAQNEMLHNSTVEQEKFAQATVSADRTMHGMAHNTKSMSRNIAEATTALLKWASLTGVISGLVGAGGLFGIERLATGVASGRRAAQGIGVTSGDQRAFGINYSRYFDPNSLLGNITDAKSDQSRRWAFGAVGVTDQDQKDPVALGVEIAAKAKTKFDQGDGSEQFAKANGLLEFFSMDELRRLHTTTMDDLRKSGGQFDQDRKTLGLSDPDQKLWQDFSIQMTRAGASIENVFVRDLTPLTPALTHLSDAFTHAVDAFLSNPHLREWLGDLSGEIERFATYLGSQQVQTDIHQFIDEVVAFGTAIGRAVKWIEGLIPAGVTVDPNAKPGEGASGTDAHGQPSSAFERVTGLGMNGQSHGTPDDRHNVTNLEFRGQAGAVQDGRWAKFATWQDGAAASLNQFLLDQARGTKSIEDLILKATPRSENPGVDAKIDALAARMGKKRTEVVDLTDPDLATKFLLGVAADVEGTHPDAPSVNRGVLQRLRGAPPAPTPESDPQTGGATANGGGFAAAADAAAAHLGEHPGEVNAFLKANGGDIDAAKTAWCAAFVNAALASVGIKGTGSDVASSFERWGKSVGLNDVHKGDVIMESNGAAPGQTGGHVGFATGQSRDVGGRHQIEMVSGNYGGRVARSWENASGVDIRRGDTDSLTPAFADNAAPRVPVGQPSPPVATRPIIDDVGAKLTRDLQRATRPPDPESPPEEPLTPPGRRPSTGISYLDRSPPSGRDIRIVIHNNTGGSAAVTASTLPQ